MTTGEGVNDMEGGEPLFSLAAVKGRGAVGRVAEDAAPDEMLASSDDDADADAAQPGRGDDQAPGSDDECARRAALTSDYHAPFTCVMLDLVIISSSRVHSFTVDAIGRLLATDGFQRACSAESVQEHRR